MSNVVLKDQYIDIPARDKRKIAKPRPSKGFTCNHEHQARKSSEISFKDHKKVFYLLSKFF